MASGRKRVAAIKEPRADGRTGQKVPVQLRLLAAPCPRSVAVTPADPAFPISFPSLVTSNSLSQRPKEETGTFQLWGPMLSCY